MSAPEACFVAEQKHALPLCIDLFCGLGGWTEGFIAEGYRVVGFDIERRPYPAQLVIQDVKTIHGSQFKDAAVIVASPPCQEFSRYAMPFGALWHEHDRMDDDGGPPGNYLHKPCPNTYLFRTCFRIQREAIEAAGRYIPLVVENVSGAQPWVGRSVWNYGSFHLWGDVPALMPINLKRGSKNKSGSWFNVGSPGQTETNRNPVHELAGQKVPGFRFDGSGRSFQSASVAETKSAKESGGWFNDYKGEHCVGISRTGSKSSARKQASAQIAKIPFELARHIASVFKPR